MNIRLLYFVLVLFYSNLNAQDFNLETVNFSENPTVEDFSFLREELKDVQVVLLGEQSHFDGNVFEMKTKIIRFLFQEMGFTTIAFESGVYDIWKAQTDIKNAKNTNEAFEKSLFTIWSKRKEFQSFIDFYDDNKAVLKLYGFDNQITGKYGEEELVNDLYAYCSQNNFQFDLNEEDLKLLIESFNFSGIFDEGDISYQQYKTSLTNLLNNISNLQNSDTHFYWTQIIKSLLSLGQDYYLKRETVPMSSFYTSSNDNIRDKQMADNLLAYIKKYPNEKIVCWGANQHFVNNMSSIDTPILKEFRPMGTYIKSSLKDKAYSLALITAKDSIYLGDIWYKTPLNRDSFEYYLKQKKQSHVFISSQQKEMNKPQLNRLFSPETYILGRLDLLHDGYLFFESVRESTPIETKYIEEKQENHSLKETDRLAIDQIKESNLEKIDSLNNIHTKKVNVLDEVVIYGKRKTSQIIRKAIENFKKNYPDSPSSSNMYSNVEMRVKDTVCLNLDFVADQYDREYTNTNRSVKKLNEARWNVKNGYEPQSLREFYSLIYNNPIKYAPFLKFRKLKKFDFQLDEIKSFNNKQVYVINFSTAREHSSYTRRIFLSNYSGTLYINKEDYAITKIIENWEVTDFPLDLKYGLELKDWLANYIKREYTNENIETNFVKVDGMYLISNSIIKISGKLIDDHNNSKEFETIINSYWSDFNTHNPKFVSFGDEQNLFKNIRYNKIFWDKYKFPK